MVLALIGFSPPGPFHQLTHLNISYESLTPKTIQEIFGWKLTMNFQNFRWNSYFLQRPTGAHWGHPGNCHEQLSLFCHLTFYFYTHNLTIVLNLNLEKKMSPLTLAWFWPQWGPTNGPLCATLFWSALELGMGHHFSRRSTFFSSLYLFTCKS